MNERHSDFDLFLVESYFPNLGSAWDIPLEEVDARIAAIADITHIRRGTYNDPEVRAERESREYFKSYERRKQ